MTRFLRSLVRPEFPEPLEPAVCRRAAGIIFWTSALLGSINIALRWVLAHDPRLDARAYDVLLQLNLPGNAAIMLLAAWLRAHADDERAFRRGAFVLCLLAAWTLMTGVWLTGSVSTFFQILFAGVTIGCTRLFFDGRLGLAMLVAVGGFHAAVVVLELAGVLPPHPLTPALLDPSDASPPLKLGILIMIEASYVAIWVGASFAANRFRQSEQTLRQLAAGLEERVRLQVAQLERVGRLRRYLAPQIVAQLLASEHDPVARRQRLPVTVMFADLRGFTAMVERMHPDALAEVLNRWLDEVSTIVFRHGGTIDKFMGDAVMAFFGAPEATGERDQALRCVRMALEVQARVAALAAEPGPDEPLAVRVGIASGMATVGEFGTRHRSEFTVVGAPVNRAARLEALAPLGGVLIDAETHALVGDELLVSRFGEVKLKGFAQPVTAYTVAPAG